MGVVWNGPKEPTQLIDETRWVAVPVGDLFQVCSLAVEYLDQSPGEYREPYRVIMRLLRQVNSDIWEAFKSFYPKEFFEEK